MSCAGSGLTYQVVQELVQGSGLVPTYSSFTQSDQDRPDPAEFSPIPSDANIGFLTVNGSMRGTCDFNDSTVNSIITLYSSTDSVISVLRTSEEITTGTSWELPMNFVFSVPEQDCYIGIDVQQDINVVWLRWEYESTFLKFS